MANVVRALKSLLLGTFFVASGVLTQNREGSTISLPNSDDGRKKKALELFGDSVNTSNPLDSFYYPDRYSRNFPPYYTTVTQKREDVDSLMRDLWDNLQTLKNSETVIGPLLADFSARAKIIYCYNMIDFALGLWQNGDGVVRVSKSYEMSKSVELLIQSHETLHGIHAATGLINGDFSLPIGEYQKNVLMYEASAIVLENLVGLEFMLDGDFGPLQGCIARDLSLNAEILRAWNEAIGSGLPYKEALAVTGEAGIYFQLKSQWWLDAYNTSIFFTFLETMNSGLLPPVSDKTYSLESARMTGYLSPDFNFTAGLDSLPSSGALCGNNPGMRNAFDYLEYQRMVYSYGENDARTTAIRRVLEKKENPYIDLSPADILRNNALAGVKISPDNLMDLMLKGVDFKNSKLIFEPTP